MLFDDKRSAQRRICVGALCGLVAHTVVGWFFGSFDFFGSYRFGFQFPYCNFPYRIEWLGILLSFALFAAVGGLLGAATLPFAKSSEVLLKRSALHVLLLFGSIFLWIALNVHSHPTDYLVFLVPPALLYALIWGIRWVMWAAKRRKGL